MLYRRTGPTAIVYPRANPSCHCATKDSSDSVKRATSSANRDFSFVSELPVMSQVITASERHLLAFFLEWICRLFGTFSTQKSSYSEAALARCAWPPGETRFELVNSCSR